MNLPNLHDGFFDGVWLSGDDRACLFVRTLEGERFTIVLNGVTRMNISNLWAGNIIFDLVFVPPEALTIAHIEQVYGGFPTVDVDGARKQLDSARQKQLSILEINTSCGAEGDVLFR